MYNTGALKGHGKIHRPFGQTRQALPTANHVPLILFNSQRCEWQHRDPVCTTGEQACHACQKGKFGDENQFPNRDTDQYCQQCPAGRYGDQVACLTANALGMQERLLFFHRRITHPYGGSPGGQLEIEAGYYGSAGSSTAKPHSCPADTFARKVAETDCVSGNMDIYNPEGFKV